MTQPEPTLIGGRYELGELLGRGGMAEVRKGTDTRLGRVVAIKRLRTDLASEPEELADLGLLNDTCRAALQRRRSSIPRHT